MIWGAAGLVFVLIAAVLYGLCINTGSISRMEERRELEEWIKENTKGKK